MKKNNLFIMPDRIFGVSSQLIKLFLPLLGVVLFLLTSMGWLILPRIESIKLLKSSSDTVKKQIASINEKRDYLISVDQSQLKQDEEYLSSAVLPEKNSYLLIGILRDVANKYGYSISGFSLSIGDLKGGKESLVVAKKNEATKMPLNIELSGPTDKLIDLIKGFENSLPILFIDKLETSKEATNTIIRMVISSYYIADKVDLSSENLALSDLKLTKDEADLLTKISQFEKNVSLNDINNFGGGTFVEYDRANPF